MTSLVAVQSIIQPGPNLHGQVTDTLGVAYTVSTEHLTAELGAV